MTANDQQLLADIKEQFHEFKCTLNDLKNPSEEFVTNFYTCWLQEFEVDINNVVQAQFKQTFVMGSYPDTYSSGIIPKVNLLRSVRAFEIVPDFGMLDIISPTPKRTQNILRAFLNFFVWADMAVSELILKKQLFTGQKEKLATMMKLREELKQNLNSTLKTIAQLQVDQPQLEEEATVLTERNASLRLEKEVIKTKSDEFNEKIKQKEHILSKIMKEDSELTHKIKEYSNQISDSPSSIVNELQSLHLKNEETTELADQKREMVESKMQAHKSLKQHLEDTQQRLNQLEELFQLVDRHRELYQLVSNTEKSTSSEQENLKAMKSLLIAQTTKKRNRQESLQSIYLKWKAMKPQLTESVEAAIRELNEKKKEKNKMINSLKEDATLEENIELAINQVILLIQFFQESVDIMQSQEDLFVENVESFVTSLMDEVRKDVQKRYKEEK